ncbi:MAG: hypothetical protein WAN43_06225 [Rhodomicrobium sp.]
MSQPESRASVPRFASLYLTDDLVILGDESRSEDYGPRFATFQVLSFSLSKLNIIPGDILRLRLFDKGEIPTKISIAAVRVRQHNEQALLLRHFLPPRQLFQNTDRVSGPLFLSPFTEIIAASACEEDEPFWRVALD